jgi:hypothetical protein
MLLGYHFGVLHAWGHAGAPQAAPTFVSVDHRQSTGSTSTDQLRLRALCSATSSMLEALGPQLRRLSIGYSQGVLKGHQCTAQDSLAPAILKHCVLLQALQLGGDAWPAAPAEVLCVIGPPHPQTQSQHPVLLPCEAHSGGRRLLRTLVAVQNHVCLACRTRCMRRWHTARSCPCAAPQPQRCARIHVSPPPLRFASAAHQLQGLGRAVLGSGLAFGCLQVALLARVPMLLQLELDVGHPHRRAGAWDEISRASAVQGVCVSGS